jgi:hypothetical protein
MRLGSLQFTEEDAETRRRGEFPRVVRQGFGEAHPSRSPAVTRDMKRPTAVNVQGFEASTKSLIWSLGIGRGFNPRPIPVPTSPHQERPRVLEYPLQAYWMTIK